MAQDTGIRKLQDGLLNILFPKECVGCKKEGSWLCAFCTGTIFINEKFFCSSCEDPSIFGATCPRCLRRGYTLDSLIFLTSYRDKFIREAIFSLKYKGCESIIDDLRILLRKFFLKHSSIFPSINLIIPVPLHYLRRAERGFNQSELIARELESLFRHYEKLDSSHRDSSIGGEAVPVLTNILSRIKNNLPQVNFDPKERALNVANIFEITSRELIANKSILLVDDVYTTGATIKECARVLKSAGAGRVHAFVLARG